MNDKLISALQAHALIIAECTRAHAEIAGKTAENMQRERRGESMAYGDESFFGVEIPTENEINAAFNFHEYK